eukprot:scaffold3248_cov112-Cylindrotheca_fusiformis.AAC.6
MTTPVLRRKKSGKRCSLVFILYSIAIYWLGVASGLFASHHDLNETLSSSYSSVLNGVPSPHSLQQNKKKKKEAEDGISSSSSSNEIAVAEDNAVPEKPTKLLRPEELKLPTPIIVMGLMKAGTTSIFGYFKCGLDPNYSKLSHYNCNDSRGTMSCGKRMRRNLKRKMAAFADMDMFHLYSELDGQEYNGGMTVPQWSFIPDIHAHFPNATWILNLRDPHDWLSSINRWQDLRQRFIDNPYKPDLPIGVGSDDSDMVRFYNAQAQRVRDYAKEYGSHHLVEVQIDSPDAGQVMEDAFGISADACWKKRNGNHDGKAVWTLR